MKQFFTTLSTSAAKVKIHEGPAFIVPSEYQIERNQASLHKFYSDLFSKQKDSERPLTGVDCLGFSFVIYKTLCYVGLVFPTMKLKMPKKIIKKYSENIVSEKYIKERIIDDYRYLTFEEFIPTSLVTSNIHELRGLNSKIVSCVDELIDFRSEKDWESSFDKANPNHKKIYVASRLMKFILDKLKLARPDFFETAKIDTEKSFEVQRSVSKIVKIYRNDLKNKNLYLEGSTDQSILGDKEYFEILMMILVENAIKYSVDPIKLYPNVLVSETTRRAQKVTIRVASFGRIIPAEDREMIFEPGFRSNINRSTASGTGMGLANARKLAALLGCTLHYDCNSSSEQSTQPGWNNFILTYRLPK